MDIVLIPGLWLDAGSWAPVADRLAAAGHEPHPVSLPGTGDGREADTTLEAIVAAVVALVDRLDDPVVVVGHSAATAVAHAVVDRRPHRVARAIHVAGFPTPDGLPPVPGWPVEGWPAEEGALLMPPWDTFHPDDLRDLDEAARAALRARAVASPLAFVRDVQRLTDPRRHDVPATLVCTDFSAVDVEGWIAEGAAPVAEIARLHHLEYVDLPTGHWPQITRPDDLARIIVERAWVPAIDAHRRIHPPPAAAEAVMAFTFLDHHRDTLRWKAEGLDRTDLARTTAASTLTLGGLVKHLAWVEDLWFSTVLRDRPPSPPWDGADWDAMEDWEFASAADDDPDVLWDLWRTAVRRSKALVAPALGDGDLTRRAARAPEGEEPVSLRWIVHHMIEEYARHNGHADLLREAIDGAVGEWTGPR